MKHIAKRAIAVASLAAGQPAFAMPDPPEQMGCPMEAIGQEEGDALAVILSSPDPTIPDEQFARLDAIVRDCTKANGWNDEQSAASLSLVIAILSEAGYENRLSKLGVDVAPFDAILKDKEIEQLVEFQNNPLGSSELTDAFAMLKAKMDGSATEEMAGLVVDYLVHSADTKLALLKVMEVAQ